LPSISFNAGEAPSEDLAFTELFKAETSSLELDLLFAEKGVAAVGTALLGLFTNGEATDRRLNAESLLDTADLARTEARETILSSAGVLAV